MSSARAAAPFVVAGALALVNGCTMVGCTLGSKSPRIEDLPEWRAPSIPVGTDVEMLVRVGEDRHADIEGKMTATERTRVRVLSDGGRTRDVPVGTETLRRGDKQPRR